ncbi:hypothetical protein J007_02375 [Cryptococcus neoformans]|nr:hypothetical protein J007_02375 [Cryptococcus neoformans var. grubii]OXC62192.1 hypothetical protein C358_02427 [Cryptococcus neoformans var. grubii MW-RSA852]
MPTRLNQPAALAPTRILEPKRHSSDQSFAGIKSQIRQNISQLSKDREVRNESPRRKTTDQQENEDDEFHYLYKNAVMPSEAYAWEKNVARKASRPFDLKGSHIIGSLPSISTSPSAFSFPEQSLRESIPKSIDPWFDDSKTDSFISTSTINNPPPTPPPKITIESDEQPTPKATQVAFNIATAVRKAPSINSFTANGSFLGLPEEADMFYRSNVVWGDLDLNQDQQASHKKLAAAQHLSPTSADPHKRLKVTDLQFEDAESDANRAKNEESYDLNDVTEKSEPLDKPLPHLPDVSGPSEYSMSTYSQSSAIMPKAAESPEVLHSLNSRPLPQWKSSTPGRFRHRAVSTKFYEHCDEPEENEGGQGAAIPNQTVHSSSELGHPRQDVQVERESTRAKHGQARSVSSTTTANTIGKSHCPAGSTLTRNQIHAVAHQQASDSVIDHSIAPAKPIMDTMTNRINSAKGSKSTRGSLELNDHAVVRASTAENQTVNSLLENEDVEIIGDLTFASSRRPSVSSSVNTMGAISFASVTAPRISFRSRHDHNTPSQDSPAYQAVRTRSQSDEPVPRCIFGISTLFSQSKPGPNRKGHRSILDPLSSFDPHVPIVPSKAMPNDNWILITNTTEDDILRKGWKDVEMRWVEGESFWGWMMRKIRGECWNTVVAREKRADEQLRMMELSDGKGG